MLGGLVCVGWPCLCWVALFVLGVSPVSVQRVTLSVK